MKLIQTRRLDLHHIEADDLIHLFEKRDDVMVLADKSFHNPFRVLIDFQGPIASAMPLVKEDPSLSKWLVRWVVLRSTQEIIGSTNFHSAPDKDGVLEIGLEIESVFQRQGYGKEIAQGMWGWAVTQPGVKTLRYAARPNNFASISLIDSIGFTLIREELDENNEPVNVYEMSADEYRKRFASR